MQSYHPLHPKRSAGAREQRQHQHHAQRAATIRQQQHSTWHAAGDTRRAALPRSHFSIPQLSSDSWAGISRPAAPSAAAAAILLHVSWAHTVVAVWCRAMCHYQCALNAHWCQNQHAIVTSALASFLQQLCTQLPVPDASCTTVCNDCRVCCMQCRPCPAACTRQCGSTNR
jgi:hypothetical protein